MPKEVNPFLCAETVSNATDLTQDLATGAVFEAKFGRSRCGEASRLVWTIGAVTLSRAQGRQFEATQERRGDCW
jgi:hypothetical protein